MNDDIVGADVTAVPFVDVTAPAFHPSCRCALIPRREDLSDDVVARIRELWEESYRGTEPPTRGVKVAEGKLTATYRWVMGIVTKAGRRRLAFHIWRRAIASVLLVLYELVQNEADLYVCNASKTNYERLVDEVACRKDSILDENEC